MSDREKKKLFASADRHLLELAQISIKSNQLGRLSDLATWASNEKTLELLIQLAKHHKLIAIVDEIESLKVKMFKSVSASTTLVASSTTTNTTTTINNNDNSAWSTPKLPELVAKESPSGILANLTPMKTATSIKNNNLETAIVSSPAELAPSPSIQSNPFAKNNENVNPAAALPVKDGSGILDYISAMMKMNDSSSVGKRKAEESGASSGSKKSSLSSNVFNNNN